MNVHFTDTEREVIRLVNYFKKRAEVLIQEGRLTHEHSQVIEACEKLVVQLNSHADQRAEILAQRDHISKIVKDNAACPECGKNTHLKLAGVESNDKGWKYNKYKCRRCNIQFIWNRPNNPWDMIAFMHEFMDKLKELDKENPEVAQQTDMVIQEIEAGLSKIEPVVEASNVEFEALQAKEAEMETLIGEFKSYLQIQKIIIDSGHNLN